VNGTVIAVVKNRDWCRYNQPAEKRISSGLVGVTVSVGGFVGAGVSAAIGRGCCTPDCRGAVLLWAPVLLLVQL